MFVIRRIVGNSMLPKFIPGDLVIGWRFVGRPKPGQVVIIRHDDKEKIKRIDKVDGDEIYVLGDNPEGSADSRQFGWVKRVDIYAKIIWPR